MHYDRSLMWFSVSGSRSYLFYAVLITGYLLETPVNSDYYSIFTMLHKSFTGPSWWVLIWISEQIRGSSERLTHCHNYTLYIQYILLEYDNKQVYVRRQGNLYHS